MPDSPPNGTELVQLYRMIFNNRAQALRLEAYERMVLYILGDKGNRGQDTISMGEIVAEVARLLGTTSSDALNAVVGDAIMRLEQERLVQRDGDAYKLREGVYERDIQPLLGPKHYAAQISQDIVDLSRGFAPGVPDDAREGFVAVFHQVADHFAKSETAFLSAQMDGLPPPSGEVEKVSSALESLLEQNGLLQGTDVPRLVHDLFLTAPGNIKQYLSQWVLGKTLFSLLAWDPQAKRIRDEVLPGKVLYLDTDILFSLCGRGTSGRQAFIRHLISATTKQLGVTVNVHRDVIREFDSVVAYSRDYFAEHWRDIQQLAARVFPDNVHNLRYVEEGLIRDYLETTQGEVSSETWQQYLRQFEAAELRRTLETYGIEVTNEHLRIEQDEYEELLKEFMNASYRQFAAKRRRSPKTRTVAALDVRLFALIIDNRRHVSPGAPGLGYDKYLLSSDGSLVPAIVALEFERRQTYVLFPNQWYELVFPLMGVPPGNGSDASEVFAEFLTSDLMHLLKDLLPIEVWTAIFGMPASEGLTMNQLRDAYLEAEADRRNATLEGDSPFDREIMRTRLERRLIEKRIASDEQVQDLQERVRELEARRQTLEAAVRERERELVVVEDASPTAQPVAERAVHDVAATHPLDALVPVSEPGVDDRDVTALVRGMLEDIREFHRQERSALAEQLTRERQLTARQLQLTREELAHARKDSEQLRLRLRRQRIWCVIGLGFALVGWGAFAVAVISR